MTAFQRQRGATLPALALTAAIGLGAVSACSGSGTPAPTATTSTSPSGGCAEQHAAGADGKRRVDGAAGRGG